ncbi:hypothetical protein [Frondihabitans australicus]|uniref:Uncharacterized protein n=1 Tax=Frondihabitans australicus TaxID=386892 RepID=A0A495IDS2_9MICO|nr:hypothetical protein [Frondihabitans australicus]RKR74132.1 hypothetical protein C8E83_1238 [Frondihabitans australicus]
MAVDGSHEGCFEFGSRLYVVPTDSEHSVAEVARSYSDASRIRRRGHRIRLHWTAFVGAALGGGFLDLSAWHSSGLTAPLDLAMLFGLGGVVGFATAIGMRQAFRAQATEVVVRLPAIQVPAEVARHAPDDATADELVLWSVLTRRFRAARVALENVPFESAGPSEAPGHSPTGTLTPQATGALAELTYVTAKHDYEPVALILGLPVPD